MIETTLLAIASIYLIITSIMDIKLRLVYDYINYSFAFIFLILRLMQYLLENNLTLIYEISTAFLITTIIGLILYKLGAWGGGDLKLLSALSIGIYSFSFDKKIFSIMQIPFFANFLINTLFAGIFFSLLWSAILMIKNRKKIIKKANLFDKSIISLIIILLFLISFFSIKEQIFFSLIIVFSANQLIKKYENEITMIDKETKKLDEGDWIKEDIKLSKKTTIKNNNDLTDSQIQSLKKIFFNKKSKNNFLNFLFKKKLIKALISIYFKPKIYRIFNKKAPGLTKEDIKNLQSSKLKKIKIKDGVPFVVSFAISFFMTLIIKTNLIEIIITNI